MAIRTYAVIDGVDVMNIILWDSKDEYEPEGVQVKLAPARVGIGWKYVEGAWVPPVIVPEPEPESDPRLLELEAAADDLVAQFGWTVTRARAVVGLPPLTE